MQTCFQCGSENADQSFCGACGSSLALRDYVATSIKEQIEARDRNRLESDAAMRVFERVFNWVKIVSIVIGMVFAIAAGLGLWKASDWWTSVSKAKQSVVESSDKARGDVQLAVDHAKDTINQSASQASQQSQAFTDFASKTQTDFTKQSGALKHDVDSTKQQIAEASRLQPEMNAMQKELTTATNQLREQQKVISSSEEFVKKVFSSHATDTFFVGHEPSTKLVTLPAPPNSKSATVVFLLSNSPIRETLQLQYRVFTQPPNSFITIHNIVIFSWGEPLTNLNDQQLSASYFPDKSDTTVIQSLRVENGRVFADGEPLPFINLPDPDFKGNKWIVPNGSGFQIK